MCRHLEHRTFDPELWIKSSLKLKLVSHFSHVRIMVYPVELELMAYECVHFNAAFLNLQAAKKVKHSSSAQPILNDLTSFYFCKSTRDSVLYGL